MYIILFLVTSLMSWNVIIEVLIVHTAIHWFIDIALRLIA